MTNHLRVLNKDYCKENIDKFYTVIDIKPVDCLNCIIKYKKFRETQTHGNLLIETGVMIAEKLKKLNEFNEEMKELLNA